MYFHTGREVGRPGHVVVVVGSVGQARPVRRKDETVAATGGSTPTRRSLVYIRSARLDLSTDPVDIIRWTTHTHTIIINERGGSRRGRPRRKRESAFVVSKQRGFIIRRRHIGHPCTVDAAAAAVVDHLAWAPFFLFFCRRPMSGGAPGR